MVSIRAWICVGVVCLSASGLAAGAGPEAGARPVCVISTSMGDIHVELAPKEAPETVENFVGLAQGAKPFVDPRTGKRVTRPFYDGLVFHRVVKGFMIQGGCPLGTGTAGPGYQFKDEISAKALGLDRIRAMDPAKGPHPYLGIRSQQEFQGKVMGPVIRKLKIRSEAEFQKRKQEVVQAVQALTVKSCYENMGYVYDDTLRSRPPKRGVIAMANSGPHTNGSQFFITVADTPWLTGKHTVFGKVTKGMDVVDRIAAVPVDPKSQPIQAVTIRSIRVTATPAAADQPAAR